jgi:hypothetical protein
MPLHVIVLDNDSKFDSGVAQGNCEYYDTTKEKAMKGYFVNSVLTGPNNILILFTNTSFQYFIGRYINSNNPDGVLTVYNYSGNGTPLNELVSPITVSKQSCTYSNGVLVTVHSSQNIQVNVSVIYTNIHGTLFMTSFSLSEV